MLGNIKQMHCGVSCYDVFCLLFCTVCKIGYYGSMCDQVCHCKGQAPCNRMTGKCPKECEEKWSGTTCSDSKYSIL